MTKLIESLKTHLSNVSAETLGWIAAIVLHASTVPTLLAVMSGLSDRMPPLDMVLLVWVGLLLLYFRATILKDTLVTVTISIGFMVQALLMALIFFK